METAVCIEAPTLHIFQTPPFNKTYVTYLQLFTSQPPAKEARDDTSQDQLLDVIEHHR